MQRVLFNFLLLCILFANISYAENLSQWKAARILGMVYPLLAQSARVEDIVKAKCLIRNDGSVEDVVILEGHRFLAPEVKANLLQWKFLRGEKGDSREVLITFIFQLKGDCDEFNRCKNEFWFEYPDQITVISQKRIMIVD
jgi:hypothetical protein